MSETTDGERERQRAMNPVTLERLRVNGSDLARVHQLINVFHAFAEPSLDTLDRALESSGFALEERGERLEYEGAPYWKVEARVDLVPTLEAIHAMTDRCVEIAMRHDAEYDGWYTEVIRTFH